MRLNGLIARTLGPLALGTALILGAATVVVSLREVAQVRSVALGDLQNRCLEREARERVIFDRIAEQGLHARRILADRLDAMVAILPPPPEDGEGSRRRLPQAGGIPVGSFVAASVAGDADVLREVAIAENLLRELGPAWGEDLTSISVAVAGRWLAAYGDDAMRLITDLLPDDPVLVDPVPVGDGEVRWDATVFEPASESWSVVAEVTFGATRRVHVRQELRIEDLLEHARIAGHPGVESLVVGREGRVLASSLPDDSIDAEILAAIAQGARDQPVAVGDWYLGVSTLPGPGWSLVALMPADDLEATVRSTRAGMLRLGVLLIAAQLALAAWLLHRGIARPIQGLVDAARRMARGERGIALEGHRGDEVGDLARAFVQMDRAIAAGEDQLRASAEELREREAYATALVASAADGVVVLAEGRIVEANPRARALFLDETAVGRSFLDFAPPEQEDGRASPAALAEQIDACAGAPRQFPWILQRADGVRLETEIGLARLDLPDERRYLLAIRDVSERRRLEEHMRHAQRMESVGQLAGGVAHDFNNVLTAIMGSAEILRDVPLPEEKQKHLLTTIITAGERAAGLTRTLLDFSRRGRTVSSPVDLHAIIRETATLLERSIDRRIDLVLTLDAREHRVIGDSAMLQNAILNLGLNARDAMPDGGVVTISTDNVDLDEANVTDHLGAAQAGPQVRIRVSDTGTGMSSAVRERIFEPFFTTKDVGKGTGLGLAAVYRTVVDHKGGIQVQSTPGQGTTFTICLPMSHEHITERRALPVAERRSGRILVVDDEDAVRTIAVTLLEDLGMTVVQARDGMAAVHYLRSHPGSVDVALIDMEMPGLRGVDCLRALHEIQPGLPAILCSGFTRDDDRSWKDQGFIAAVAKPYRREQLLHALDTALKGRHASA